MPKSTHRCLTTGRAKVCGPLSQSVLHEGVSRINLPTLAWLTGAFIDAEYSGAEVSPRSICATRPLRKVRNSDLLKC